MASHNSDSPSPHLTDRNMNSARTSPPMTPPESNDSEVKLPQKREREVSLEPATTPRLQADDASIRLDHARTPAKKNRIHLDSTQEEEDGSRSRSPSPSLLGTSPPQEIKLKVRQISQGVEDLSWRNLRSMAEDEEVDMEQPEATASSDPDTSKPTTTTNADNVTTNGAAHELTGPPSEVHQSSSAHLTITHATNNAALGANDIPLHQPKDGPNAQRNSDSDEAEDFKGVKRKFFQRGTSQGPQDVGPTPNHAGVESVKRARDDSDKDDNPRETKRPSPPPEKSPNETTAAPKFGGFMSYASANSPFASVKGKNVFSPGKPSTSSMPPTSPSPAPSPFASLASTPAESSTTSTPTATKRSGFEAFASPASPFAAAARSKSPGLGSSSKLNRNKSPPRRATTTSIGAFTAYASSGIQGFSALTPKRARAGSPNVNGSSTSSSLERTATLETTVADSGNEDEKDDRQLTFGERLRATGADEEETKSEEEESKVVLTEQDVLTGEEDEETIHQARGKLFVLANTNSWKEKGTGLLKLNVRRSDGGGARLVMRKDAVYALMLNVTLFHGMRCSLAQDPRYLRFSVIKDNTTTHYNLRLASANIAHELMEEILANVPPA